MASASGNLSQLLTFPFRHMDPLVIEFPSGIILSCSWERSMQSSERKKMAMKVINLVLIITIGYKMDY